MNQRQPSSLQFPCLGPLKGPMKKCLFPQPTWIGQCFRLCWTSGVKVEGWMASRTDGQWGDHTDRPRLASSPQLPKKHSPSNAVEGRAERGKDGTEPEKCTGRSIQRKCPPELRENQDILRWRKMKRSFCSRLYPKSMDKGSSLNRRAAITDGILEHQEGRMKNNWKSENKGIYHELSFPSWAVQLTFDGWSKNYNSVFLNVWKKYSNQ